jgi:hypothetical protein
MRQGDGFTSPDFFTTSTNYTFANLTAGTYAFYFYSVCGEETSSGFIVTDDVIGN